MATPRTRALKGLCIGLIGTGAVARYLVPALEQCGASVRVHSRSLPRARALGTAVARVEQLFTDCDVLLVCVPDRFLAAWSAKLAQALPARRRTRAILHTSGAAGSDALHSLTKLGLATGYMHPLLSLPRGRKAPRAGGLPPGFAVGGDAAARRLGTRCARALGGLVLAPRKGSELDYHLAASLVANGAVALFALAEEHMRAAGVPRAAYAALLESVAHNLATLDTHAAQSGPITRGDVATLARHWQRLSARSRSRYRGLAEQLIEISPATAPSKREMRRVLRGRARPG